MSVRNNYTMINIREYLALGTDEEVGEPALVRLLSDFHVQRTRMLNIFSKKNAIEFTKRISPLHIWSFPIMREN